MNRSKAFLSLVVFWVISIVISIRLYGQSLSSDTLPTLGEPEYIQLIKKNHPVIKQAMLLGRQAEVEQQKARGNFDPKLFSNIDQKSFDQKNYFTIGEGGVKVPSWYGVEFKAAYLWSNGEFLNPENKLPNAGQALVGLSANVLQGLLIDVRRAALQQAKILKDLNQAEQKQLINDLLLAARKTYWEWQFAYERILIYQSALQFAEQQFRAVRESFFLGDKPAIDTVEARIAAQTRQIQLNEAQLEYQNTTLLLSNYLWSPNNIPLNLAGNVKPLRLDNFQLDPVSLTKQETLRQQIQQNHPALQAYTFKLAQLEIDQKLKTDKLKPQLQLEFNLLSNGGDFINNSTDENNFNALFTENYKWGARFSFPLLLRKERASIQLNQVKTLDTEYSFQQKRQELQNKLESALLEQQTITNQIDLQNQMTQDYQRLLDAENEKFQIGESSVFLVNSRQQKLIEAQLKLAKLKSEFQKAMATVLWAAAVEAF